MTDGPTIEISLRSERAEPAEEVRLARVLAAAKRQGFVVVEIVRWPGAGLGTNQTTTPEEQS